jgi:hypothetical protein
LIVLYRRVGDIRSPAALGAWLVRVVVRLCALPVLMFMRSVEELKTIEDSVRFAHVPVDQLRLDVARALAAPAGDVSSDPPDARPRRADHSRDFRPSGHVQRRHETTT